VEFQVVLLQYLFGDDPEFRIIPVLCGNISDTMTKGVEPIDLPEYKKIIDNLKEIFSANDMCIIAGADLSHIGPRFGDQEQVSDQMLDIVKIEDHKVMETFEEANPKAFFSSIAAVRNKWRVCGFPPILAQLYLLGDCKGKLAKYCQAKDPYASVTFAAFSFYKS
jgi:AmmeMemoRadiSam system protein B